WPLMTSISSPTKPARKASNRPPFRELLVVAGVVLLGVALRIANPSRLAVEHFDEGVYASNLWFGEANHYQYPGRFFYAPTLLPALIEWVFILAGPSNGGAIVISLVAGCLTIPLV